MVAPRLDRMSAGEIAHREAAPYDACHRHMKISIVAVIVAFAAFLQELVIFR
jgi:hypothetical protein